MRETRWTRNKLFFRCSHCPMSLVLRFAKSNIHILSSCLFVCSGFLNCFFFCFVFQEILYGFGEEFFSLHVRRCRERLSVVVTRCATRNGREKILCFLLFSLLNFACGEIRKIEYFPILKQSSNHLAYS